jgi:hypothetical protein
MIATRRCSDEKLYRKGHEGREGDEKLYRQGRQGREGKNNEIKNKDPKPGGNYSFSLASVASFAVGLFSSFAAFASFAVRLFHKDAVMR